MLVSGRLLHLHGESPKGRQVQVHDAGWLGGRRVKRWCGEICSEAVDEPAEVIMESCQSTA